MAKNRHLQQGIVKPQFNKVNNAFERKLVSMKWKIEVAKRMGKPLDLDIYSGPLGLGVTVAMGAENLFSPYDITSTIIIRIPFPILTSGEQYQKFMEAIKTVFKTVYLS